MAAFNDYFMDEYRYALSRVEYKKHLEAQTPDLTNAPKFIVEDSYTIGERNQTEIHVTFSRTIHFDPSVNFNAVVEFDLIFSFNKNVSPDVLDDQEIIGILKNAPFTSEVISRASLLIAQITLIGNLSPVILPPNYIFSVESE